MKQNIDEFIADLDDEIIRTKLLLNTKGYHHGTSMFMAVYRYRNELKQLKRLALDDKHEDNLNSYKEVEDAHNRAD